MGFRHPVTVHSLTAAVLLALCSAGVAACRPATQEAKLPAREQGLDGFARERISAAAPPQTEWRDAVAFQSDLAIRLDLGSATPRSTIRVGLLDSSGAPVSIRLLAGDRVLNSAKSAGEGTWTDWRLAPEGLAANSAPVTLEFAASGKFWVSTAELVTSPAAQPPVIVVLVDTLRRDHLGCYGYARPTSPNIDTFAKEAIRFERFVPASSWTRPSVASLMTSTMPGVHGAEDLGDHLREGLPRISEVFGKAGYETRALVTNPNCLPIWGFGDGFSRFIDVGSEEWLKQDDGVVMKEAAEAVRDAAGRPFFLYVHALAPHEPFTPAEPYRSQFASAAPAAGTAPQPHQDLIDLYDAEIRYFDTLFGEFVATLKETGVYDSSIIVFLSDHGQAFGEHGNIGHGSSLYEEQMNPPLIVRLPGGKHAGGVHDSLIEMIDVAPTLAALAAVSTDPRFQGRSFVPVIENDTWEKTLAYASLQHREFSQYMARTQDTKYIRDVAAPGEKWFDLAADPLELHPLQTPAANEAALRGHVEQMTSLGQVGLHILITSDSAKPLAIAGEIQVAGLGEVRLDYPKDRSALQSDLGAAHFTVHMPGAEPGVNPSARLAEAMDAMVTMRNLAVLNNERVTTEQDYAGLSAQVAADAEVNISLSFDGALVIAEQVHFGASRSAHALDGRAIPMAEVRGSSVDFDPAALPVRLAVYVWYVPSPDQIYGDQLTPEIRESMRALGYITD